MDSIDATQTRPKNFKKIGCLGCFLLPCLCLLGTFGYIKYLVHRDAGKLPDEVAKLRKMGVATEPADLSPQPPVPESENAAPIYREMIEKMKALSTLKEPQQIAEAVNSGAGYPEYLDDEELEREGLKTRADILKLADEAVQRPRLDFGRDYALGPQLIFPEFSYMKEVAKWLATRATLQAESGDFEGAIRSLRTGFAVGGQLSQEPILIAGLVSISINAIMMMAAERVTEYAQNNPAALAQERSLLESLPPLPDMRRDYGGEVVSGRLTIRSLKSFRELSQYTESDDSSDTSRGPNPLDKMVFGDPDVRRMLEAKYVGVWRQAFERMPTEPGDWRGRSATMEQIGRIVTADNSLSNRVNQIMFPVFSQAEKAWGEALARRRVALAAVRLLQERPKGLPKDLSGFGDVGVDPMDGKPLRYKREGKGFKVWSIGQNLVDDGGVKYVRGTGVSSQKTDVVWGFGVAFPAPPPPKGYRRDKFKTLVPPGSPRRVGSDSNGLPILP